jgi:hypothetical protein
MLTVQARAVSKLMMVGLMMGLNCLSMLSWAGPPAAVSFDAPAIVIAEPINPSVVELPTMGGELVRLRIPVSTIQASEFRGQVHEYIVEIDSPYQSMRMLDFWPKSEVYSEIEGNVSVESSQQHDRKLNFSVAGVYEPFGKGAIQGDMQSRSNVQERYQRKPAMQVVSASGTIQRGFGVFFKFRPGPLPVLEGVRDLAILAEVPPGWRADMLQIHLRAVGTAAQQSRSQTLGEARLWITTHREGDQAAAAAATRYVTQERALRSLAASNQQRIDSKALPTIWHKLGASLDVIEPRIPLTICPKSFLAYATTTTTTPPPIAYQSTCVLQCSIIGMCASLWSNCLRA